MIESDVELTVCLRAEARGWLVRKLSWIGRRNAPDRFFARDGRVVLIEFKRPGKVARETQNREIQRLREAGVEAYEVDNIEAGDAILGG